MADSCIRNYIVSDHIHFIKNKKEKDNQTRIHEIYE